MVYSPSTTVDGWAHIAYMHVCVCAFSLISPCFPSPACSGVSVACSQSKAHWLSMNESEHPSNLSLSAGLGSLPHNCRFIHTTCGHTLNSFFVGSLRTPLDPHHFWVQIKWKETQCENWTPLPFAVTTRLCLHCHLRLSPVGNPGFQPHPYLWVVASSVGHKPEGRQTFYKRGTGKFTLACVWLLDLQLHLALPAPFLWWNLLLMV